MRRIDPREFWDCVASAGNATVAHLLKACSDDPKERATAESWLSKWSSLPGGASWCCDWLGLLPPHFCAEFDRLLRGTAKQRRRERESLSGVGMLSRPTNVLNFRLHGAGKLLRDDCAAASREPLRVAESFAPPQIEHAPSATPSDGVELQLSRCRRGHLLTPDNCYQWRGEEHCRCCRAEARNRWRAGQGGAAASTRPVTAIVVGAPSTAPVETPQCLNEVINGRVVRRWPIRTEARTPAEGRTA